MDDRARLQAQYAHFARVEIGDRSPSYQALCDWVLESEHVMAFLLDLPLPKRQPNLLLATLRLLGGVPQSSEALDGVIAAHGPRLAEHMRSHATQTNEPGRCAALLPILADLPGPLALIEVGASAGLCLLPDRYAYDYDRLQLRPREPWASHAPTLACHVDAATPVPTALPEVVWRAGVDLSPFDVTDEDDRAWLRTFVWPEETQRAARLDRAMEVARLEPPRIEQGDLLERLPALVAQAPREATAVVFHTSVLCYLSPERRAAFQALVTSLPVTWISNEHPAVFPTIAERVPRSVPEGRFVLARGAVPMAFAAPHGQALTWCASS